MQEHPEGGYFIEYYRSSEMVSRDALPIRYNTDHCFSTAIHYLLKSGQKSQPHTVKSDEIWHFHEGSPLKLIIKNQSVEYEYILGNFPEKEQLYSLAVPNGSAMSAEPLETDSYTLVSCTVAPGFEYDDFELV